MAFTCHVHVRRVRYTRAVGRHRLLDFYTGYMATETKPEYVLSHAH
jgi:hypothetical protein